MSIRGAFIAIFDQVAGRKIAHQWPDGFIDSEEFDAIAEFVIPKPQLCGQLVCLLAFGSTVLGFPICIEHPKYPRNALLFNLCFVLDGAGGTGAEASHQPAGQSANYQQSAAAANQHGSVLLGTAGGLGAAYDGACAHDEEAHGKLLTKLARSLRTLEVEAAHLSDPIRRAELATLLPRLLYELNANRQCTLVVDITTFFLMWALEVLTDLVALGCVVLTDIITNDAVYVPTARLTDLARSESAQLACATYSKRPGRPTPRFRSVFNFYCRMSPRSDGHWATVGEVCTETPEEELQDIEVRRCVQFALLNCYLQRLHAYPRLEILPTGQVSSGHFANGVQGGGLTITAEIQIAQLLDGGHSDDEIACALKKKKKNLRALLDRLRLDCAWLYRADSP
ncbi:nitrogen permease regulator 2-domain-containing protein [Pavlovales sp. CCMP2436]|nr:nitrogen permease regulator 2-domain-containing protein [Pavlovales sp. CCMP2436]